LAWASAIRFPCPIVRRSRPDSQPAGFATFGRRRQGDDSPLPERDDAKESRAIAAEFVIEPLFAWSRFFSPLGHAQRWIIPVPFDHKTISL
jgi:hypothetical protein